MQSLFSLNWWQRSPTILSRFAFLVNWFFINYSFCFHSFRKADVWAMSVVVYAMLNNRFPFHFQDVKKLYKEQVDYPSFIRSRFLGPNTESVRNLMELMFNPNEKDRPTMADVLQHEWILNKGKTH